MNILEKIRLLWRVRKPAENIIKEVTKMKDGYKTTEFWITVITNLITVVGALKDVIPAEAAVIILAVLNGVYTIVRGFVKTKAE